MKHPAQDILQQFTIELLAKLEEHGYEPVGIAGAIIYATGDADDPSKAHTFCTFAPDIVTSDGATVDGPSFMKDVSKLLVRTAEKGES